MTLHCASRLGFLDQLYKNRHKIAYTMGLIAEIPIAMCNRDYDFNDALVIEIDDNESLLYGFLSANEINLFYKETILSVSHCLPFITCLIKKPFLSGKYSSELFPVFHPPSNQFC